MRIIVVLFLLFVVVLVWKVNFDKLVPSAVTTPPAKIVDNEDARKIYALMDDVAAILTEYNNLSERYAKTLLSCARETRQECKRSIQSAKKEGTLDALKFVPVLARRLQSLRAPKLSNEKAAAQVTLALNDVHELAKSWLQRVKFIGNTRADTASIQAMMEQLRVFNTTDNLLDQQIALGFKIALESAAAH